MHNFEQFIIFINSKLQVSEDPAKNIRTFHLLSLQENDSLKEYIVTMEILKNNTGNQVIRGGAQVHQNNYHYRFDEYIQHDNNIQVVPVDITINTNCMVKFTISFKDMDAKSDLSTFIHNYSITNNDTAMNYPDIRKKFTVSNILVDYYKKNIDKRSLEMNYNFFKAFLTFDIHRVKRNNINLNTKFETFEFKEDFNFDFTKESIVLRFSLSFLTHFHINLYNALNDKCKHFWFDNICYSIFDINTTNF